MRLPCRGWEVTIINQRDEINEFLMQSPSLKRIFLEIFDDAFAKALKIVKTEYPTTQFCDRWLFTKSIDSLLTIDFWG